MRLINEIKVSGNFWLHDQPENVVAGFLKITDGGYIELELFGLFSDDLISIGEINSKALVSEESKKIKGRSC